MLAWGGGAAAAFGVLRALAADDVARPAEISVRSGANGARRETPPDLPPVQLNLRVGERLEYELRVGGVPAGKAHLVVRKQEKWQEISSVWGVALEAYSNRLASLYYRVATMAKSSIDTQGGFSRKFWMESKEGPLRTAEDISFTYDVLNRNAVVSRERGGRLREYPPLPLSGKVLDPLSMLYYIRAVDLDRYSGDVFVLPVCTERRVWSTRVHVSTPAETFDAGPLKGRKVYLLRPELEFRGLFERRGPIELWVDARTRVPLRATVELPIGRADMLLDGVDAGFSDMPVWVAVQKAQ
jgi:hypothetical protein